MGRETSLRLHPVHRPRPRPPGDENTPTPLQSSLPRQALFVQAPPTTDSTYPGPLFEFCPRPPHRQAPPTPPPALKPRCSRGSAQSPGSPSCFKDGVAPSALARRGGPGSPAVSDLVRPSGWCGLQLQPRGALFKSAVPCAEMEGPLLRGLAAQQVSEAGAWRAVAWTETGSRASSVACTEGGERKARGWRRTPGSFPPADLP